MTPIQKKFFQAAKLLVEIRLLAAKQGAAYRAENKLALARSYENTAHELQDNISLGSLDGMVRCLEHDANDFYKPDLTVTEAEVQESMTNLLRYVNSHRPTELARLTEEFVMGTPDREKLQAEWTADFGDHSECPVCGTACEMLYVEGK